MFKQMRKCVFCEYYEAEKKYPSSGICKRHPRSCQEILYIFHDDWCGEFKLKQPENTSGLETIRKMLEDK